MAWFNDSRFICRIYIVKLIQKWVKDILNVLNAFTFVDYAFVLNFSSLWPKYGFFLINKHFFFNVKIKKNHCSPIIVLYSPDIYCRRLVLLLFFSQVTKQNLQNLNNLANQRVIRKMWSNPGLPFPGNLWLELLQLYL